MSPEWLEEVEAYVLGLVLQNIALRGRIAVEENLRELEELVGRELPPLRAQIDRLFDAPAPAPQPPLRLPPQPAEPGAAPERGPHKRGPGRPRKQTPPEGDGGQAPGP